MTDILLLCNVNAPDTGIFLKCTSSMIFHSVNITLKAFTDDKFHLVFKLIFEEIFHLNYKFNVHAYVHTCLCIFTLFNSNKLNCACTLTINKLYIENEEMKWSIL